MERDLVETISESIMELYCIYGIIASRAVSAVHCFHN